jgi:predicted cobalt transporter CbtA
MVEKMRGKVWFVDAGPATTLANAVFWLALGGLMGLFYKKLATIQHARSTP